MVLALLIIGAAVSSSSAPVIRSSIGEGPKLVASVQGGITEIETWLKTGPLQLTDANITSLITQGEDWAKSLAGTLAGDVMGALGSLGTLVIAASVFFYGVVFFLLTPTTIWGWIIGWMPSRMRTPIDTSGPPGLGRHLRVHARHRHRRVRRRAAGVHRPDDPAGAARTGPRGGRLPRRLHPRDRGTRRHVLRGGGRPRGARTCRRPARDRPHRPGRLLRRRRPAAARHGQGGQPASRWPSSSPSRRAASPWASSARSSRCPWPGPSTA